MRESQMNARHQQSANKIIAYAFRCLVQAWPRGSRDWAVAMQSELSEIDSPQESLRWLRGGIMSLAKAWWNQVIYGWNENEKEPSAAKTPGPVAIALALAALAAFFLMPSVHEGFSAVVSAWPHNNARQMATYQRMAQEAEARGDAKTLAFISSRMNLEEDARLKDKAVELDPSLTWIYFSRVNSWYIYNHIPQTHGWMQKLEASDPENALTYLTEASVRYSELWNQFKYQNPNSYQLQKDKLLNDPVWLSDMEKAFAAPRYDSYYDRFMDLQQSVLKAHNLRQPDDVSLGLMRYYSPGLSNVQDYSKVLLNQAKEAQQKGNSAQAIHLAWTILQFSEKARASAHSEVARFTLDPISQSACSFLLPLESAAGHADVASLLAAENEALTRSMAEKNPFYVEYLHQRISATGIALHSAGAGLVLFGGAILLSFLFLIAARFIPSWREGTTYRWVCNCGRFSPAGFAAAIALMAAAFAPYLEQVDNYLEGVRTPATLHALTAMEGSLYDLPWRFFRLVGTGLLWEGLIPAAVIAGILFLSRKELFRRPPRVKVA